jgi:hypothetical protein
MVWFVPVLWRLGRAVDGLVGLLGVTVRLGQRVGLGRSLGSIFALGVLPCMWRAKHVMSPAQVVGHATGRAVDGLVRHRGRRRVCVVGQVDAGVGIGGFVSTSDGCKWG